MKKYDNSHLITRCIEKNSLAWAEFVRRFSPLISFSIRRALKKYTRVFNLKDLEDIKQDVFIMLWSKDKLRDVKDRNRIDYWLSTVSMNMTINHLRSRNKEFLAGDLSGFENAPDRQCRYPLEEMSKYERIKEFLAAFNAREKIIFKLRFEKNKKDAEISRMLNIPLNSVTSTISRIRKKLKNLS